MRSWGQGVRGGKDWEGGDDARPVYIKCMTIQAYADDSRWSSSTVSHSSSARGVSG